jgi:hypothetical protein
MTSTRNLFYSYPHRDLGIKTKKIRTCTDEMSIFSSPASRSSWSDAARQRLHPFIPKRENPDKIGIFWQVKCINY